MRTKTTLVGLAIAGLIAGGAYRAGAADIGVAGTKLIVVDKFASSGTGKAVFVAKDSAITKGSGTDVLTIGGQLQISYDNLADPAINGAFNAPTGSNWLVNKATVAKYVNKDAPTGGGTKVSVIKPGNLVKLVGKNIGDSPLNILSQSGAASGEALTAYCLSNGSDANCFCSDFAGCAWKSIAGDTGAKLVCKGGTADATCGGISTRCLGGAVNDVQEGWEQCDDGDANDGNGCTKTCTACGSNGGGGSVLPPLECQTTLTCKTGPRNGLACDQSGYNRVCTGGTNDGTVCDADADCTGGGTCSVNSSCQNSGLCTAGPTIGAFCLTAADCGVGGVCSAPAAGFCSTNNIVGCDANCTLPGCGNNNVSGAETCDDGGTSDFDSCPADCILDACVNPASSPNLSVSVNFAGSANVAGITVFVDYPEGSAIIPGSGGDATTYVTNLPGSAGASANDYDHAVQVAVADFAAFPAGLLFNLDMETCNGATPTAGQFTCTVISAGDASLVPIPGVTCSVTIP